MALTSQTMPTAAAEPRSNYRFLIEALLFLSYFVFGLSWIGYAPFLKDFQARFALSHARAALLISSVSLAKIFVPFAAGWLAARLGIQRALLAGMLCICASLASPFAADYNLLLASRFVFGIGGAVVVTLFGAAILQWFPPQERPLVNGFNGVAVNAGISTALFITVPLAEAFGQTRTLAAYAVISLVLTLLWWLFGRDRGATVAAAAPAAADYLGVLRMPETWYLALGFAGPLSLYLVFNTWLPTFYSQMRGLSVLQATQLTGLANLVGIPAAILGGVLTQRTAARKPWIWGFAIVTILAAFGMFIFHDLAALRICAVLYGVSIFIWVSPLITLAMELPGVTPVRFGMMMGVFFGVSYIAAFFAPLLTGALRDSTGSFLPGFTLFSLSGATLVVAGLLLPETGKVKSKK